VSVFALHHRALFRPPLCPRKREKGTAYFARYTVENKDGPRLFSRLFLCDFLSPQLFLRTLLSDTSWLQCVIVRLQAAVWMSFCPTVARATGASTTATRARMQVLFLALCAAFLSGSAVTFLAAPTWGSVPLARSMAARYVHKAQPSRVMSTYV